MTYTTYTSQALPSHCNLTSLVMSLVVLMEGPFDQKYTTLFRYTNIYKYIHILIHTNTYQYILIHTNTY
jgi:hypothetical protein